MAVLADTTVLLGKELRTEFRSRELLTTTVVFILVVVVLFSFTFDPSAGESRRFGPGLLWLSFLFTASLMLQPCFLREQNNDTLSALRLSVRDPFSIFLAKLSANTLFLLLTEVLMLPVFAILYNVHILGVFLQLVLVLFLGSLGVAIPGTAFSAISAQARMRELMLPLLLLPLLTPVLIASTEATRALLDANPVLRADWLGFLAGFDVVSFKAAILFVLIAVTGYLAFYYAPIERSMGVIQKIFYLHISCAFSAFVAFGTCFYANLRYVFTREAKSDWLGVSAAEVGLAFITVVLVTGPIWAHPVWGIWWTWDARLTLTFVLGLLYLSYLLLRSMIEEPDKRALFSALFGIFAFLDVPLVYFSIRWWRTQHPQPVILGGPGSGLEPRMRVSYLLMWGALTGLLILLLSARYKLEALRASVDDLRREAEVR